MSWSLIWKWSKVVFWILLAAVVVFIPIFYLTRKKDSVDVGEFESQNSSIVKKVKEEVKVAVADAKIERAVIKTKSDIEKKKIEEIKSESDGKKRRKKIAEFLEYNL
jgi:hypothetical protein